MARRPVDSRYLRYDRFRWDYGFSPIQAVVITSDSTEEVDDSLLTQDGILLLAETGRTLLTG